MHIANANTHARIRHVKPFFLYSTASKNPLPPRDRKLNQTSVQLNVELLDRLAVQMFPVPLPQLADLPPRELLEYRLVPGTRAHEAVELSDDAVAVPLLEPVEEVPRRFVPCVPRRPAAFSPVWGREACV